MRLTLAEVSHLDVVNILVTNHPERLRFLEQELDKIRQFGEQQILSKTKKGDLVLLESPLRMTREQLEKLFPAENYSTTIESVRIALKNVNLYADLADFCLAHGRKTGSLDTGVFYTKLAKLPNTSFTAAQKGHKDPDKSSLEAELLMHANRDKVMKSRVKKHNPKLVIAAARHIIWLGHTIPNNTTVWQSKPLKGSALSRKLRFEAYNQQLEELRMLRKERREFINKRLKQRKMKRM
ncbi:MAG: hypothetical protein NTY48_05590 [Candidatus Diapherotrites archaeon]|nr:hypothetical protein [Candidatus Diapherotrites archaeon]